VEVIIIKDLINYQESNKINSHFIKKTLTKLIFCLFTINLEFSWVKFFTIFND